MTVPSLATPPLERENRILLEADLTPAQGERFQPTGFPDLGAATFRLGDGTEMLILESAQSMANRLEEAGWDRGSNQPATAVAGLPFVRVVDADDKFLTSSRLEAHRLASAYVREARLGDKAFAEEMKERLGLRSDRPADHRTVAQGLFALDPVSLLHGVFFAIQAWPSQPKIARSVSSFIEARGVRPVDSGGVKRDEVHPKAERSTGQTSEGGYGWIPFPRREFTADSITAYFNLDLVQIRSFGLPQGAADLLVVLGLWEIRSLLDGALRLRTACDLEVRDVRATRPAGCTLPPAAELETRLGELISECRGLFGAEPAVNVKWIPPPPKKGGSTAADADAVANEPAGE